jgi:hypothetical protein
MRKTKTNFLTITIFMLTVILVNAQSTQKTIYAKVYWFATGIEQRGSDLLLDNPGVVSEIITLECELPNAYQIGNKFEEYFIANYAKDQGVTDVFVYPFLFGTLEEAQAKRKDIIDKIQASENTKICWVKEFKYQCN